MIGAAFAHLKSKAASPGRARWFIYAVAPFLAWPVLAAVLPHGAPAGVVLSGAVFGAINSLVAMSIVLVWRANRVINFAAAEFGSVAAVVAIELHIQQHVNYFLSVGAGLASAAVLGAVLELFILRRFAQAPRLIVAVATIGIAQLLNGASLLIPIEWTHGTNAGSFTTPWSVQFRIFPVVFDGNYVTAVLAVAVAMGALVWFLRFTHYGVAVRAAADNSDRARLLAVPVRRLATIVWTITAVLSALAILLRVPIVGFSSFDGVSSGGLPLLLETLTAAVLAGMNSLPGTVVAAIGLGVADQLSAWTFRDSTYVDAALLVVILISLLARRERLSRASETGISSWISVRPIRPIPPELAGLPEVRAGRALTTSTVLVLALILPRLLTPAHTQLATLILIYAIVACSLVVLTGWAGHISLGQIAFMGFGGATTSVLLTRHGADFFVALAVGALVASAVAVLVGLPALRISGPFLAVTTLAFAVTAANYFLVPKYFGWFSTSDAMPPVRLFGRIAIGSDREMYYLALLVLALVIASVRGLRNSAAGRAILAGQSNRLAAQSFAIDTTRNNLVAFAISGALAGLAGGLFVVQQQGFNFGSFNAEQGLQFFTMVVIGGLGSIPGAVLGAVYVYGAQYFLPPGWSVLATGAGIVVLLMFLPGGVGELVFRLRDQLLRVAARRRDLVVPSLLADQVIEEPVLPHPPEVEPEGAPAVQGPVAADA